MADSKSFSEKESANDDISRWFGIRQKNDDIEPLSKNEFLFVFDLKSDRNERKTHKYNQ